MAYRGSKRVVALKRGLATRCRGRKFPNGDTDHWDHDELKSFMTFLSGHRGVNFTADEWRDIDAYIYDPRRWDAPEVRP